MQSSPGSPFQRRPTSSKNNPDTFSSFCAVHPPPNHMRMRTRNDEEFFGSGFRRSSSLRRSSNNNGKKQYIRIIFSAFKSLFVCLCQAKYRKYYTVAQILTSNSIGTQFFFLGCNQDNNCGSNFITKKKFCLVPPEKEISIHRN